MKILIKTNDAKEIGVSKLKSKVQKLEANLSAIIKKNEYTVDLNCQVNDLKKSIKMKEKDNYNLNTQLLPCSSLVSLAFLWYVEENLFSLFFFFLVECCWTI